MFVAVICFTPHIIYKSKTFIPHNAGVEVLQSNRTLMSIKSLIKIAIVQETISNLAKGRRFDTTQQIPESVLKFQHWILSLIVYFF